MSQFGSTRWLPPGSLCLAIWDRARVVHPSLLKQRIWLDGANQSRNLNSAS